MSDIDWAKVLGGTAESTFVVKPTADLAWKAFWPSSAKWPPEIRALMDAPNRPRPTSRAEVEALRDAIMNQWPDYVAYRSQDSAIREPARRRMHAALIGLGYTPGRLAPDGSDFRSYNYDHAVYRGVTTVLQLEHASWVAANVVTAEEAGALDALPDEPIDIAGLAEAWGTSTKTARKTATDLIASGHLVVTEVPSSRGGKPRKLYVRADASGAAVEDGSEDEA